MRLLSSFLAFLLILVVGMVVSRQYHDLWPEAVAMAVLVGILVAGLHRVPPTSCAIVRHLDGTWSPHRGPWVWVTPGLESLVQTIPTSSRQLAFSVDDALNREQILISVRGDIFYTVDPHAIREPDRAQTAVEDLEGGDLLLLVKVREVMRDVLETTSLDPRLATSVRKEVKARVLHRLRRANLPQSITIVDLALGALQPALDWQQAVAQHHSHQHVVNLARSASATSTSRPAPASAPPAAQGPTATGRTNGSRAAANGRP